MGGSLSSGLRTVFAIVLACLVIGFVFMVWSSVKESGNTALTDSNSMVTQMEEAKYTQYDGATVTGSEVVNVIKQHTTDDICIQVQTPAGTYNYVHSDFTLSAAGAPVADTKNKTSAAYISPNAKFTGTVNRDASTQAILGMTFVMN